MHAVKTHWRIQVQLHAFLTSALDKGELSRLLLLLLYACKTPNYPLNNRINGSLSRRLGKYKSFNHKVNHDPCLYNKLKMQVKTQLYSASESAIRFD
jgi:hypothetical protein